MKNDKTSPPPVMESITFRGQKHTPPEGRHSQQSHRLAEERARANGHASEKEQQAHDRTVTLSARAGATAEKRKQQESSQARRTAGQKAVAQNIKQEEAK